MQLVQPLKFGKHTLQSNLLQGPLAGTSCGAFRRLAWQYSGDALGYCMTEMLMAYSLAMGYPQAPRYTWRAPEEQFLAVQLSASQPELMVKAALRMQVEGGADMIDINCGCPVKKIRRKRQGSHLLSSPALLQQLVSQVKSETDLAVSVKIRVDGNSEEQFNTQVLEAVHEGGADLLIVHGRHWQEDYSVSCHHDQVAAIVEQTPIPVVANGDVDDAESCKKLFEDTGCAGVMIARAGVGQPWLFKQIRDELAGHEFSPPTLAERGEIFLSHIEGLVRLDGERNAVLQARGLVKYYLRDSSRYYCLKAELNAITDFHQLQTIAFKAFV